jgi:protein ImuB
MQPESRVACVRIPRFPIAAVWRDRERRRQDAAAQLTLELPTPRPDTAAARDVAPSRSMNANGSRRNSLRHASAEPGNTPAWDDRPLALAEGEILRVVSSGAARARVRPGMKVAAARALCAQLEVMPWDDLIIGQAVNAVTAALIAASPQVTPVAGEPGLWWAGADGLEGVGGEHEMSRMLLALARSWHPRARIAIADACVTARAATWSSRHTPLTIVPRGGDACYLAPAPLALVPMDDELRQTLAALGITTAGALASLEAEDVERRWGDTGLAAWRLARGEDDRRSALAVRSAPREVSAELPASSETMEPVLFLVRAALDRLVTGLVADGRSAAAIAITLTLDDRRSALPWGAPAHTITREVRFPRPSARTAPLFDQCRALLERWPLTAPVSAVRVAVVATAIFAGEQGDLLATRWRDPAAVDAAFARLRAELGPEVVVRAAPRDDHRPEREGVWKEEESAGGSERSSGSSESTPAPALGIAGAASRASRLLESPEEVDIERDAGVPSAVWWRGERLHIARAEGPERISGEWWQERYRRDYWRCESERGALLVYRDDLARDQWYVQGWMD